MEMIKGWYVTGRIVDRGVQIAGKKSLSIEFIPVINMSPGDAWKFDWTEGDSVSCFVTTSDEFARFNDAVGNG